MFCHRCPKCQSRINLTRSFDNKIIVECNKCKLFHIFESQKKIDLAYLEFLDIYKQEDIIKREKRKLLEDHGIVKSKTDIENIVNNNITAEKLPPIIKEILYSDLDFIAEYQYIDKKNNEKKHNINNVDLNKDLIDNITNSGIKQLLSFQIKSIKSILNNKNTIIISPTGSGKTEAFAIPVIQKIIDYKKENNNQQQITALFIYPTKSLTRDQIPKINRLTNNLGIKVRIYDGDSTKKEKDEVINNPPDILLTNFDSIHYNLIYRTELSRLINNIKFIVLDETHIYNGTFGSNVYFILKRLERLCGNIQYIATSATIENPEDYFKKLINKKVTLINEKSGLPSKTHFLMVFPYLRKNTSFIIDIIKKLNYLDYKTLCFSSSHLMSELIAFYLRRTGVPIRVHRSGISTKNRLRIEEELKNGLIKTVSCTPTLELGIDIGHIDSVISDLVVFNRLKQRIGRSGRKGQESIAILVLRTNDPISQYYRNNPKDYFKDVESSYVDSDNITIMKHHIIASAMDKWLTNDEWKENTKIINELIQDKILVSRNGKIIPSQKSYELMRDYNIRGSGENIILKNKNKIIGYRNMPMAMHELYPGAIYFLEGQRYISNGIEINSNIGVAKIDKIDNNYPYYNKPLVEEYPEIKKVIKKKRVLGLEVQQIELSIKKSVIGYVNIRVGSEEKKGEKNYLNEPIRYNFLTKGIVFNAPIPQSIIENLNEDIDRKIASSYHATEHVIIEGTDMITGGVSKDMGGLAMGTSGLIFIYDASVGGNGATQILFDKLEDSIKRAYKMIKECPCTSEDGCPRCTYSYRCGNNNENLDKKGAEEVLFRIINNEIKDIGKPVDNEKTFT